jgi:DNA invertase Pin-like site-specific DNA recombinase
MAARPPDQALAYLRRSTGKQEASVPNQLEWAIAEARRVGVHLDATPADLRHMLDHGLTAYKGIFIDDGVTGSNLNRPGFVAFRARALAERRFSHLFIHMPDRFARPDQATQAQVMELELLHAGITVVFSTRVSLPRQRGLNYIAEDILILFSYSESGEFLNKLAIRVLESQIALAKQGHWTGGRPPYGFVRVRVDADGTVTEMADKTSIRRPGSHTEIRPKDGAKIRGWGMMLEWWVKNGWGTKRIAAELNALGIPSPDAGRTRTENGRRHRVSGTWTPSTVRALLSNRAIVAVKQYGVQSEGAHRRLGPDGRPRLLDEADECDGKFKAVNNPADNVIRSPMGGFAPPVDRGVFDAAQAVLAGRGKSQRGIAKTRDPGRYPLSTRVYDLACGYPMWASTSGQRRVYTCGKYVNTSGRCCAHNRVDAEATLLFAL